MLATWAEIVKRASEQLLAGTRLPMFATIADGALIFGSPNASLYVKDRINNYVVHGQQGAVNPNHFGTKVAADYVLQVEPQGSKTVRLRLLDQEPVTLRDPFADFWSILQCRKEEADEFYRSITPALVTEDEALVMRQALSGMLCSKQSFNFNLKTWLSEHGADPIQPDARPMRNDHWIHMINEDVISMPDKWEYPW